RNSGRLATAARGLYGLSDLAALPQAWEGAQALIGARTGRSAEVGAVAEEIRRMAGDQARGGVANFLLRHDVLALERPERRPKFELRPHAAVVIQRRAVVPVQEVYVRTDRRARDGRRILCPDAGDEIRRDHHGNAEGE